MIRYMFLAEIPILAIYLIFFFVTLLVCCCIVLLKVVWAEEKDRKIKDREAWEAKQNLGQEKDAEQST